MTSSAGIRHPQPGKVTVVFSVERNTLVGLARTLSRYSDEFRDRGLNLVALAQTLGYAADTAPVAPEREALFDSTLALARYEIPTTLAVFNTTYTWVADGRRRNEPIPVFEWYTRDHCILILDKRGVVRYVAACRHWDLEIEETLLARFIERLLAE